MHKLIAIAYDDETLAGRAVEEFYRCTGDFDVDPDASAVLVMDRDGSRQLITTSRPGATVDWGRLWIELLGPLEGEVQRAPASSNFVSDLVRILGPGMSGLLLAVPEAERKGILASLNQFRGRVVCGESATFEVPESKT